MKPIEVSAALLFRAGRLLVTQRRPGDHLGGLWEFPGGKMEPGETSEECLARELREELGIEVAVGALAADITHAYPEKTVRLCFHLCTWIAHEPRPIGCHALAWITRDELGGYEFPAADARLIELLRDNESWWREAAPAPP